MREENSGKVTQGRVYPDSFSSNTAKKNKKDNGIQNAIKSLNGEQKSQNKAIADLKKDVSYLEENLLKFSENLINVKVDINDDIRKIRKNNSNIEIALIISVGILYLIEILKLLL